MYTPSPTRNLPAGYSFVNGTICILNVFAFLDHTIVFHEESVAINLTYRHGRLYWEVFAVTGKNFMKLASAPAIFQNGKEPQCILSQRHRVSEQDLAGAILTIRIKPREGS